MFNYLSFGGGVNSVALHLLLLEQGVEFESVFVHHGTDWPETYDYVAGFQWWLKSNGHKPITILIPEVKTIEGKIFNRVYDYYFYKSIIPVRIGRMCTDKFKVRAMHKYMKKPAYCFIGIDAGESHRAKIAVNKGIENRWPLIENDIDRIGCINLIKKNGLPEPVKSGCYICPFQPVSEFKKLRSTHPDLFCKVEQLEKRHELRRRKENKHPNYIRDIPVRDLVNDNQHNLFKEMEYPPCQCGL